MQFPERRGRLVVRPRLRLAEERIGLLASDDERIISGRQLAVERGGLVIRKEKRRGRLGRGGRGGRFTYSSRCGVSGRSGTNLPLVVVAVAPDAISGENYARSRSASTREAQPTGRDCALSGVNLAEFYRKLIPAKRRDSVACPRRTGGALSENTRDIGRRAIVNRHRINQSTIFG